MLGYGEDKNWYNIFDTSTHKNFIEISVQFEEDIIPYFELARGECSSPRHQDDVSDDSISDISDSEMDEDGVFENESPSRPKWVEKTIEPVGDLVGNPLDPRNTRSQFKSAYFENELIIHENWYMMVGSDPQSY